MRISAVLSGSVPRTPVHADQRLDRRGCPVFGGASAVGRVRVGDRRPVSYTPRAADMMPRGRAGAVACSWLGSDLCAAQTITDTYTIHFRTNPMLVPQPCQSRS